MPNSNRRSFLKNISLAGLSLPFADWSSTFETRYTTDLINPDYLSDLKKDLTKQWPGNKTINIVFHGHSVPSGYFKTPAVNTAGAYPNQVLLKLKSLYPFAVINTIITAIGGENAKQGAPRINEVLTHKPDLVFIDYALNDRGIGLPAAKEAWTKMIDTILEKKIKLILLTPSPDLKEDIKSDSTDLQKHSDQIRDLAKKYQIGLADSYQAFKNLAIKGEDLNPYMSQFNHPNEKGHQVIADCIMEYFT